MKGKTLFLAVKREYFEQIQSGLKTEEYRIQNDYWKSRLELKNYKNVVITLGYPPKFDFSRRIEFPYRGYEKKKITHKHFGDKPVLVYAIKLK